MSKAVDCFADDYLVFSSELTFLHETVQFYLGQVQYAGFLNDHAVFADTIWKHRPLLLAQVRRERLGKQRRMRFASTRERLRQFRAEPETPVAAKLIASDIK